MYDVNTEVSFTCSEPGYKISGEWLSDIGFYKSYFLKAYYIYSSVFLLDKIWSIIDLSGCDKLWSFHDLY